MAQVSFPFDGQAVTETQYSKFFREFAESGIAASADSTVLKVGAGTGMAVTVQPGFAIVRGFAYDSSDTESLTINASGAQDRYDRIVLRLSPSANSIVLAVLVGTVGSSVPPSLTQTDTGIYELPLAQVRVPGGAVSIESHNITDERLFGGFGVGNWTDTTRPSTERQGRIGYNRTSGQYEFWTGSQWAPVTPSTPIGTIVMYGGTVAPAGWHLCNGTAHGSTALQAVIGSANTPDLRDRFIVGTGPSYAQGSTGGAASVTLTAAQSGVPSHTHTAWSGGMNANAVHSHSAWSGGMDTNIEHAHPTWTATDGHHNHGGSTMALASSYTRDPYAPALLTAAGGSPTPDNGAHSHAAATAAVNLNHVHGVGVNPVNIDHTHGIGINPSTAANASQSHENRPPYYALTFIIRKS